MRQANYTLFQDTLVRLEKDHALRLSGVAVQILYDILDAMIRDPHPYWKLKGLGSEPLDAAQKTAIEALPDLLGKLDLRKKGRTVTTFEVLHLIWPALNGIIFKDVPE